MPKLTIRTTLPLSLLFLAIPTLAHAQGFSPFFGMGTAHNSSGTTRGCPSGFLFDNFTGLCEPGPTMGGLFGVFGVDFMFSPHLGVNGEYAFRFSQADYLPAAGLKYRPAFYDFNAVWEPVRGKRIVPVLGGGIGGARIALYVTQQCSITGINCTATYSAGINANHFQVHGDVGLKLYVHGNIFIKPQFDFHYVNNLTDQFGRNWVPQYTGSVGYTFGEH
jgi:hypothetical protein